MPITYRLQVYDKVGVFRFTTNASNKLEHIQKLVLGPDGDCKEGTITGLASAHGINPDDTVEIQISSDGGVTWSVDPIYSGFVPKPGNPNAYRVGSIEMLGLSRRFDEIETLSNQTFTGDVGATAKQLIIDALPTQTVNSIIYENNPFYWDNAGVNARVTSEFRKVSKILSELTALVPNSSFGVVPNRRPFFRVQNGVQTISAIAPGNRLTWKDPDTTNAVNAVRWIGPEVQRIGESSFFLGAFGDAARFVTYLSKNTLTGSRYSVAEKEFPSGYAALKTGYGGTFERLNAGVWAAMDATITDGVDTTSFVDSWEVGSNAFYNWSRVYRVKITAGTTPFGIRVKYGSAGNNMAIQASSTTGLILGFNKITNESEQVILFSAPEKWSATDGTTIILQFRSFDTGTPAPIEIFDISVVTLDTALLDQLAKAEYREPQLNPGVLEVPGILANITKRVTITNTVLGTITVPVEAYEYGQDGKGGLRTLIHFGEARDQLAAAVWRGVRDQSRAASADAVRFSNAGVR